MKSRNIAKQLEWLITCEGHPSEVQQHIETGEVPERIITGLEPALTTYFWLYKENHNMCHLYLDLKPEEALS